jgi:hypothetical protein
MWAMNCDCEQEARVLRDVDAEEVAQLCAMISRPRRR